MNAARDVAGRRNRGRLSSRVTGRASSRFSTIRAKTTVAATLVVTVALLLAGIVMLVVLRRSLVQNVDDAARRRAQDVSDLYLVTDLR